VRRELIGPLRDLSRVLLEKANNCPAHILEQLKAAVEAASRVEDIGSRQHWELLQLAADIEQEITLRAAKLPNSP